MVEICVQSLAQIASFLKVSTGKIRNGENAQLPSCTVNQNTVSGYLNILEQLTKEANSSLCGSTPLEKALVRQWVEYGIVYIARAGSNSNETTQILKESLAILDKEKYINVSRWFDNLQQDPLIRQSNTLVNFSTIYLANVAPARH